jgi:hypothetical protein
LDFGLSLVWTILGSGVEERLHLGSFAQQYFFENDDKPFAEVRYCDVRGLVFGGIFERRFFEKRFWF